MLFVVAIVSAWLAIQFESFRTVENVLSVVRSSAVLGILGIGLAVVLIGRGIDLSQIAVMVVSSSVTVYLLADGFDLPVALVVGLLTALAIGVVNGWLVAFAEIPGFFATLASALFIIGLGRATVLQEQFVRIPSNERLLLQLGQGRLLGVPVPVLVFALVMALAGLFLSYTRLGRFVYAQGTNPEAARLTGIPVRPLTILIYSISAMCAFFAGLLHSSTAAAVNTTLNNSALIFDVFTVVIVGGVSLVGGRGAVRNVFAGVLLIAVAGNGMTLYDMELYEQNVFKGLILLAAILLDNYLHPRDEETRRQGE